MSLRAGKKDSVASVARRYRVSAAQVAQWNGLAKNANFTPGQSIVVYVAGKAPRSRMASGGTRKPVARHLARTTSSTTAHGAAKHANASKPAKGRVRVAHN
jgi:membrane-bound lytic murein transglycosylase D